MSNIPSNSNFKPDDKVYLTRCIRDKNKTPYSTGEYLAQDLPAIAYEWGFVILKPQPKKTEVQPDVDSTKSRESKKRKAITESSASA